MKAVKIKNLIKTYSSGVQALKGIDLSVDQGDFFGLLGPNGAGKTTTISIITSLVNKTAGDVTIFDVNIDTNFPLAKSYLGIVPQEFNSNLFDKVIRVVLNQAGFYGIPRSIAYQRAEKYLKKLGLWNKRNTMIRFLSGGMKRRLMIAKALIHEPRILILDEPTAGVDIELRRATWDFLRELNAQGVTIILTTHYLEEAESLCKNVAIIDEGEILANTSVKNLLGQLDVETFVFDCQSAIPEEFHLERFIYRIIDSHAMEVDVPKSKSINCLFKMFSEQNVLISSMRNKVNRLEELFVRITQKAREP